jgi:hypothetical protein
MGYVAHFRDGMSLFTELPSAKVFSETRTTSLLMA